MRAAASFIPGDEADSKVTDYNTAAAFIKKKKIKIKIRLRGP